MTTTETKKAPIFNGLIRQEYIQQVINLLTEYKVTNYSLNSVACDIMHISLFAEFNSEKELKDFYAKVALYMCQSLY